MRIVYGQLPVQFGRKFHLGAYEGTHAQVLFRSGRTGYHQGEHLKYESVVDVLFKNVAALAIMESYYPLEISMASEAELVEFQRFLKYEIESRKLYVLRGGDSVGYVVAGAMYWVEDRMGSTERSSVLISQSDRLGDIEVKRA